MLTASSLKPAGGDISPSTILLACRDAFLLMVEPMGEERSIFADLGDIRRYLRHPAAAGFTAVARAMAAVADAVCRLFTAAHPLADLPLFGLPGFGIPGGRFSTPEACWQMERLPHAGCVTAVAGSVALKPAASKQIADAHRTSRRPLVGACAGVYHDVGSQNGRLCAGQRAVETAFAAGARKPMKAALTASVGNRAAPTFDRAGQAGSFAGWRLAAPAHNQPCGNQHR